ncbi:MAG: 3-phosphoshikimate 1-carboxyvinyltransferase, partial [Acidimicrobiales bacterium]
ADVAIDARLSGTTSRFIAPVLALGSARYRLDGGEPLRRRPMATGFDALRRLGADVVELGEPGHLPVQIGGGAVRGGEVRLTAAVSSQFASGLLQIGPCLAGGLTVRLDGPVVSRPYLDLTVAVMSSFGAVVDRPDPRTFVARPGGYRGTSYAVEPDASAASYFFAAAAITGGRVRIDGLGSGSLQGDLRFVDLLARMGAEVTRGTDHTEVRGTGTLRGITADMRDLSDTAQTLAAVAVFAEGPTEVTGIGFIRGKETDRLGAVVAELHRCGVAAEETADGFRIDPGTPHPAVIETYHDHRMAMSFALLGLRAPGIEIADPGCVGKTFPDYFAVLDQLRGASIGEH